MAGECPLHLVNQNKKENDKMTPNDIATSIAGLGPVVDNGNIGYSTSPTFCCSGGQYGVADDQRSWD